MEKIHAEERRCKSRSARSSPSRSPRTPTSSGERGSSEAFVIDPGFEPDLIREVLVENGLTLAAIVCTHGHVDHIAGNRT